MYIKYKLSIYLKLLIILFAPLVKLYKGILAHYETEQTIKNSNIFCYISCNLNPSWTNLPLFCRQNPLLWKWKYWGTPLWPSLQQLNLHLLGTRKHGDQQHILSHTSHGTNMWGHRLLLHDMSFLWIPYYQHYWLILYIYRLWGIRGLIFHIFRWGLPHLN